MSDGPETDGTASVVDTLEAVEPSDAGASDWSELAEETAALPELAPEPPGAPELVSPCTAEHAHCLYSVKQSRIAKLTLYWLFQRNVQLTTEWQ